MAAAAAAASSSSSSSSILIRPRFFSFCSGLSKSPTFCQPSSYPSPTIVPTITISSSFYVFNPLHRNALASHCNRNDSTFRHPWPQYRSNYAGLLMARALNNTSIQTIETSNTEVLENQGDRDKWTIKMLYDGDCPLCLREVNMLRKRNENYGTIKFVDISSKNYSAEENSGVDFATAMGRIHAILRDGSVLYDIAAFKRLYEEVGLGWVYAFTRVKAIAMIADAVYAIWAKYRLPITGRPPLHQILQERERKFEEACDSDRCRIE